MSLSGKRAFDFVSRTAPVQERAEERRERGDGGEGGARRHIPLSLPKALMVEWRVACLEERGRREALGLAEPGGADVSMSDVAEALMRAWMDDPALLGHEALAPLPTARASKSSLRVDGRLLEALKVACVREGARRGERVTVAGVLRGMIAAWVERRTLLDDRLGEGVHLRGERDVTLCAHLG